MRSSFIFTLSFIFVHAALAQEAAAPGGQAAPTWISFFPIIVIFAFMYFFMIRPQAKKQKEHQAMLEALKVGDQVITNSGFFGRVSEINEQSVNLTIATGVVVKILRSQIMGPQAQANPPAKT